MEGPVGDDLRLSIEWLGCQSYADALTLQETAVRDRLAGRTSDRLFLLEHPRVVTLGRSSDPENLKLGQEELESAGVELFEVGRGGDVTYHAPGQLVGYPILDLDALGRRDVHMHLRSLEAALIESLEEVGIPARRIPGWTGVFIDRERSASPEGRERKIASIGVGVRRWVTFHGFALNVTIELDGFQAIVPCGLHDVEMTSVEIELAIEAGGQAGRDGANSGPSNLESRENLDRRMRQIVGERMCQHLSAAATRI
jgi:lipoyl(octanoyl) transferase